MYLLSLYCMRLWCLPIIRRHWKQPCSLQHNKTTTSYEILRNNHPVSFLKCTEKILFSSHCLSQLCCNDGQIKLFDFKNIRNKTHQKTSKMTASVLYNIDNYGQIVVENETFGHQKLLSLQQKITRVLTK